VQKGWARKKPGCIEKKPAAGMLNTVYAGKTGFLKHDF
jgi:hypothetical protein